jgi:D-alanine-D-alanine ligase
VVVEAYISGREFSVGVVDDQVYPVIEIAPLEGFYDYKNKYTAGSTVETCPAEITAEETKRMQEYADRANRALMVEGYARWDFLMDHEGNIYCLEGNTLPGMTPTSLLPQEAGVLGITFPQLCELLVKVSMKKYES